MGILAGLASAWAQWQENRRQVRRSLRTGEPWPVVDAAEFAAAVEASGLFGSVEAVPVAPLQVDLHLEALTGHVFLVMLRDGSSDCRIVCEGYVFDWVPTCLAPEFMQAVIAGEVEVAFSKSGGRVLLGVPLPGEGTWWESRVYQGELAPWEARVMTRDRTAPET
ncbi:hypothetical protein ACFCX4_17780 [Kitasatospora sp. NPDC056327]|uniref:hypothetical protein n=1 Tax=Kitasatospora sp. NPDC056327 TaxID=3345785 RepID=UPI0035D7D9D3